jgi:hypothetical protein
LQTAYGIDNTAFLDALADRGFQVVHDARANHPKTTMSLASTMSVSLLVELSQRMGVGNGSLDPIRDLIANSRVGSMLQEVGHRYIHVGSWYGWTRGSSIADEVRHLDAFLSG